MRLCHCDLNGRPLGPIVMTKRGLNKVVYRICNVVDFC
jgi:hypothetical protein